MVPLPTRWLGAEPFQTHVLVVTQGVTDGSRILLHPAQVEDVGRAQITWGKQNKTKTKSGKKITKKRSGSILPNRKKKRKSKNQQTGFFPSQPFPFPSFFHSQPLYFHLLRPHSVSLCFCFLHNASSLARALFFPPFFLPLFYLPSSSVSKNVCVPSQKCSSSW